MKSPAQARAPLWPERKPTISDQLEVLLRETFPDWGEIAAAGRHAAVSEGHQEDWRRPGTRPDGSEVHHFGDWQTTGPDEVCPRNVFDFGVLSPVSNYLDAAADVLIEKGDARRDPIRHGVQLEMLSRLLWQRAGRPIVSLTDGAFRRLRDGPLPDRPLGEMSFGPGAAYVLFPDDVLSFTDASSRPPQPLEGVLWTCDRPASSPEVRRTCSWWMAGRGGDAAEIDSTLFTYAVLGPNARIQDVRLHHIESWPANREARLGTVVPRVTFGALMVVEGGGDTCCGCTVERIENSGADWGVEYVVTEAPTD